MPKVVGRLPFFFVPSPLSPPQLCTGGWHSLLPLRPFAVALVLPTLYPWSSWCRWEHEETIGNHWAAKCDSTCFIGFGWIWFKRQSTGFSLVFGGDWDWLGLVTRLPSQLRSLNSSTVSTKPRSGCWKALVDPTPLVLPTPNLWRIWTHTKYWANL